MEVELSENTVIPCPLFRFALRRVKHCLDCEHYKGLTAATVNGVPIEGTDSQRHQVICGKPITRSLQEIVE